MPHTGRYVLSTMTKQSVSIKPIDEIVDAALAANSFRGPLNAGCWSKTRMTCT